MLQRWRSVISTVSDLTGPKFEPQNSRSRDEHVTARPTGRLTTVLNRCYAVPSVSMRLRTSLANKAPPQVTIQTVPFSHRNINRSIFFNAFKVIRFAGTPVLISRRWQWWSNWCTIALNEVIPFSSKRPHTNVDKSAVVSTTKNLISQVSQNFIHFPTPNDRQMSQKIAITYRFSFPKACGFNIKPISCQSGPKLCKTRSVIVIVFLFIKLLWSGDSEETLALRDKLPPAHLSTAHSGGFTLRVQCWLIDV